MALGAERAEAAVVRGVRLFDRSLLNGRLFDRRRANLGRESVGQVAGRLVARNGLARPPVGRDARRPRAPQPGAGPGPPARFRIERRRRWLMNVFDGLFLALLLLALPFMSESLHGYMMRGNPKAFDQKSYDFTMQRALSILEGLRAEPLRKAS